MLNGTMIECTVVGGPAHNSRQIEHGDFVLEVDGNLATNDNIIELLIGNDIPGSVVKIKLAKGAQQEFHIVDIQRFFILTINSDASLVAGTSGRCEIEENGHFRHPRSSPYVRAVQYPEGVLHISLFFDGQVTVHPGIFFLYCFQGDAIRDQNSTTLPVIDESLELWNRMWIAEQTYKEKICSNIHKMQHRCESLLFNLQGGIDQLYGEPSQPIQKQVKKASAATMHSISR